MMSHVVSLKQKRPSEVEHSVKAARTETSRQLSVKYILSPNFYIFITFLFCLFKCVLTFAYLYNHDRAVSTVADVGPPADWVKINVLVTVSII